MIHKGRGIGLTFGFLVLIVAVFWGLRSSGNGAGKVGATQGTGTPVATTIAVGTCRTERGILGSTKCNPSPDQVAKSADIPIPASATNFAAIYEGFQDWHLEASFLVPLDQASVYQSLPNYPGAAVDGPETDGTGGGVGEYRRLKLTTVDGVLKVAISVFTT
jgi:hypothetical protein